MVFEYSPEMSSSSADGISPFLKPEIVGKASSSFTQGSSMFKVAGKNRLPTMQCAPAGAESPRASRNATAILERRGGCMELPPYLRLHNVAEKRSMQMTWERARTALVGWSTRMKQLSLGGRAGRAATPWRAPSRIGDAGYERGGR